MFIEKPVKKVSSYKTVQLKDEFQENPNQAMSVTLSPLSNLTPKWFLSLTKDDQKECYQEFEANFDLAFALDKTTFMVPKTQAAREVVAKWVDKSKVYG
jgi:hypothetical protein